MDYTTNQRYNSNKLNRRTSQSSYIVEGTAARKYDVNYISILPKEKPRVTKRSESVPNKNKIKSQKTNEVNKQRRVNEKIAMRNREKALKIDLKFTMFMCFALLAIVLSCVLYLSTQTKIAQKNSNISALRSELGTLVKENTSMSERINDLLDLDYVREYAINTLGMVYPNKDQIEEYTSSENDYVKQYQDIPLTDKK